MTACVHAKYNRLMYTLTAQLCVQAAISRHKATVKNMSRLHVGGLGPLGWQAGNAIFLEKYSLDILKMAARQTDPGVDANFMRDVDRVLKKIEAEGAAGAHAAAGAPASGSNAQRLGSAPGSNAVRHGPTAVGRSAAVGQPRQGATVQRSQSVPEPANGRGAATSMRRASHGQVSRPLDIVCVKFAAPIADRMHGLT